MNEPLPPKKSWEVDFPIDRQEAQHVSRREFAKFLCVVSGGLCVGSGWLATKDRLFPPQELSRPYKVCTIQEVGVGEMKQFVIPENNVPYILIRLSEAHWRAFEQKCTHLSCSVYYRKDLGQIECPCHNGFFDAETGQVLQGPPPRPLPQLVVELRGEDIYVTSTPSKT